MLLKLISGLIITCVLFWITRIVLKICRIYKLISKIPGPATTFPFGNLKTFINVPFQKYHAVASDVYREQDQEAPLIRVWLSAIPAVLIVKAEAAEVLLKSSVETTKAYTYSLLKPWLGNGLLTSDGQHWHSRRKLLSPSFHFQIVNSFVPIINEKSQILVKKLTERQVQGVGNYFDVFPFIALCALDIVCETAMGMDLNAQNHPNSEYVKALHRFGEIFGNLLLKPWTELPIVNQFNEQQIEKRKCIKIMQDFTKKVIEKKKQERKCSLTEKTAKGEDEFGIKKRKAFLDTMLDAIDLGQDHLTDEELRAEVDTFMFGGHDTTACGIAWTVYFLGKNPDVQLKVQQELEQVLGSNNNDVTIQDLPLLKYLEATILESMRLMPPVPVIGRQLKHDIDINGCVVPGGTAVGIVSFVVNRDPRFFPEPEKFIPERHLGENTEKIHPFAFLPFSAGPRNCIGQKFAMMKLKIVLANIFRSFRVECRDEIEDIDFGGLFINRPLSGIYIRLKTDTCY